MSSAGAQQISSDIDYPRSEMSQDFEWLWHTLRAGRRMPHRNDLTLANAKRFVADLVLTDFCGDTMPVRIAGQRFQELSGCNITGDDMLSFMFRDYRDAALETSRLMATMPCGLWQITPMHLARGYAQPIEITGFPLAQDDHVVLLFHVRAFGRIHSGASTGTQAMALDTARCFRFLDVGEGEPEWPARAA